MERVHGFCGRKIFPKESGDNLLLEASSYLHSCTGIGGGFLAGRARAPAWVGGLPEWRHAQGAILKFLRVTLPYFLREVVPVHHL